MAGEGQAVDAHGGHIHRDGPQGLGGVHQEEDAPLPAEGAYLFDGKEGTGDVGAVAEHDGPDIGGELVRQTIQDQLAPVGAGQVFHGYPLPLQLLQGTKDGVVLHGGGEHLIPGAEQALEQQVEGGGGAAGKDHVAGAGAVDQSVELLPHLQHPARGVIGLLIAAPGDVAADIGNKVAHGLPHAGSLGIGCGAVIQIDAAHGRFLLSLHYYI